MWTDLQINLATLAHKVEEKRQLKVVNVEIALIFWAGTQVPIV